MSNVTRAQAISQDGFRKKALICGITGQDGSLLAKFLSVRGYEV